MFKRGNLTDFEKLLWAESYIKELKKQNKQLNFEIGVLTSEKDELIHVIHLKKDSKEFYIMKKHLSSLQKERSKIKKLNSELLGRNKKLNTEVLKLKGIL